MTGVQTCALPIYEIAVRSFLRQLGEPHLSLVSSYRLSALARALKFLRHRNLIHRDIKPQVALSSAYSYSLILSQNLLLNPASQEELARGHPLGVPILKVADFGFARSLPNAMMADTLCGSPYVPSLLNDTKS